MSDNKKKSFKMPSSFTILFMIIVAVAILTWIVPAGEYSYVCADGSTAVEYNGASVCPVDEEAEQVVYAASVTGDEIDESLYDENSVYQYAGIDQNRQGLWQILMAVINGFRDAIGIALFVIVIGGFLGVVIKTGALSAGIGALLKKFKGREEMLIPILMILFGIGGTTFGMAEETIAFYLLIVPVFLLAGYDAVVGVMVILLGAGVGVLASTVNPFAIGVASEVAGVSMGSGIVVRFILFIIVEAIAIAFTIRYARRVKGDMSLSKVADLHDMHMKKLVSEDMNSDKMPPLDKWRKIVLCLFSLTFVVMIVSVIPWEDFNITIFSSFNSFINDNLTILTGDSGSYQLGWWWFDELSMLFLTAAIIIGIIGVRKKLIKGDFISVFVEGAKDLLPVALIIGLARGIKVVMADGGMDATLLYTGSRMLESLGEVPFIIGTFLFYIPMSFLIPSTSGLAGASMPVVAPLAEFVYNGTEGAIYAITAFSAASGIVNLITATSGVVMGGLALARVPYDRWLKHVMPLLIALVAVVIVVLSLGTVAGI